MKIEVEEFVSWLERGEFDIGKYRKKAKSSEVFDICYECVMARFLASKDAEIKGCGNITYWVGDESIEMPPWAKKVVAKFDEISLTVSQAGLVKELSEVARKLA